VGQPLLVGVILLGLCLVGLIAVELGNTEIERIDEALRAIQDKTSYVGSGSLQANVRGMAARAGEASLVKSLADLAEALRFSDPMSDARLAAQESELESKIALLGESVAKGAAEEAGSLCARALELLAERNRQCKLLKF
jgi:hypothetical protein